MADLIDGMFTTPEMTAIFAAERHVQRMLDVEAALARAEARAGVVPAEAATAIEAACRVDLYDLPTLYREAIPGGTLAIPVSKHLAARVEGPGKRFVHWGATSQDVVDTATVLQVREALAVLEGRLLACGRACRALAEAHRHTPMAGRTLLQQALPITFGLKAARWLALVGRRLEQLRELRARVLVIQFGGAAGTLASLGDAGCRVADLLAEELGLGAPELPWHTERDRVAEVAAALGIVAGAMAKIAADVVLMAQSEVGEVSEASAPGKGGSSTLPHKRNPVDAMEALAAARLALAQVPVILSGMVQAHERAVGEWQAEWSALPDLFRYTDGAVDHVVRAVEGLSVDAERMRANLDVTQGLIMAEALSLALAPEIGRQEAHQVVQAACARAVESGRHLRDVALAEPRIVGPLSAERVRRVLDPAGYLGSADAFVDRALAGFRAVEASIQAAGDPSSSEPMRGAR